MSCALTNHRSGNRPPLPITTSNITSTSTGTSISTHTSTNTSNAAGVNQSRKSIQPSSSSRLDSFDWPAEGVPLRSASLVLSNLTAKQANYQRIRAALHSLEFDLGCQLTFNLIEPA